MAPRPAPINSCAAQSPRLHSTTPSALTHTRAEGTTGAVGPQSKLDALPCQHTHPTLSSDTVPVPNAL
eukprot:11909451-Ditylum_brightwellii.AAC.1